MGAVRPNRVASIDFACESSRLGLFNPDASEVDGGDRDEDIVLGEEIGHDTIGGES